MGAHRIMLRAAVAQPSPRALTRIWPTQETMLHDTALDTADKEGWTFSDLEAQVSKLLF